MTPQGLYLELDEIYRTLVKSGIQPIRLIIDESTHEELRRLLHEKFHTETPGTICDVTFPGAIIPIQIISSKSKIVSFVVK